jgi:macrolide transport system ATP-binding/permease protein
MFILTARQLKKWMGDQLLFQLDELNIAKGEKIGIVGVNGAGKTTLLRVLAGESTTDEGNVQRMGSLAWIKQWEDNERSDSNLSGGEQMRKRVQKALMKRADLLLADEPTSHLDLEGTEWVEQELKAASGSVLLISHDRALLDAVCSKIMEIENGKCTLYPGNYTNYRKLKEQAVKRAHFEYEQYQKEKKRLSAAIVEIKERAAKMSGPPKRMNSYEASLHKAKAASKQAKRERQAKTLKSRLEQLEPKQKPFEPPLIQFDIQACPMIQGKTALKLERVSKRIGERILFSNFSCRILPGTKVALIGRNGAGKSTLLQMILQGADGVKAAPTARIGYYHQHFATLDEDRSILENVGEESPYSPAFIRTILAHLQFRGEKVHQPVRVLSGGERSKVALAKIFVSGANLLLLDEPNQFLDLFAREALERVMHAFPGTVLFVSHDRQLVRRLADQVIVFENGRIIHYPGTYVEWLASSGKTPHAEKREQKEALLRVEHEISEVLGRLSLFPDHEEKSALEQRFQVLLLKKKELKGE